MLPFQLSQKWNQCSPHMVPHWMTNPTAENQLRVYSAAAGVHLGFEKNWWLFSRWCRTHTVGPTFSAAARLIPSILLRDCWQQFATDINGSVLHVVLSGNCSSSIVAGKSHPLWLHLKKEIKSFTGKLVYCHKLEIYLKSHNEYFALCVALPRRDKSSPRMVLMILAKIFNMNKQINEAKMEGPKPSSSFSQNLGFSLHTPSLFFLSTSHFCPGRGWE